MDSAFKKQSVQNNLVFQLAYQAIILLTPLVISPFLTRTLGDTSLGVYSYVHSIAYYFVIFANLGIVKHGQRVIARSSGSIDDTRRVFWSLFTLHAIVSAAAIFFYFGYIFIFVKEDIAVYVIEGFYVASALCDITWLFYGLENFRSVVIKNSAIKILECVLLFLLIRTPDDLWLYTLITASSLFLGQLVMIPQAIKILKPIKFGIGDVKSHVKPLLVFSISVIAVSLYTMFDKTLLGLMTTKENVAYYEYANKIVSLPRTFITTIGTVMFPRACKMAKEKNTEGQRKYLKNSLYVVSLIGSAAIFILLAVSRQFAVILYGEAFRPSGYVMMATCALPLIIGLGDIVRTQYMIPTGMDRGYITCIVLNAVVNLIISISLIPVLGIYGAVLGTCSAELFGLIFQLIACRKFLPIKTVLKTLLPFFAIGTISFLAIETAKLFLDEGTASLLIQFGVGIGVFAILTLLASLVKKKLKAKDFLRN